MTILVQQSTTICGNWSQASVLGELKKVNAAH